MFGFVKQIFVPTIMFFGYNLPSVNSLECVLVNSQECKMRLEFINVNSKEPVIYFFSIKTSKRSGSCNNKNMNMNIKVFNLMSRTNETRYVKWLETCKCKM